MSSRRAIAIATALAVAAPGAGAIADEARPCETHDSHGLDADAVSLRLSWIQARLARTGHRAVIWLHAWEIGIVAATAIDLAMIPALGDTRSHRIDFGLGAATTIIGLVPVVALPPRVIDDHRVLDAWVASAAPNDRCAALADAEWLLRENARAQAQQRAWYMHAGNLIANAGVTLLFGAYGHWGSGVANGIGGFVIGELIIYTEPVDQPGDLERYRRGELAVQGARATTAGWRLVPAAVDRGGFVIGLARNL